jgi:hypothetical protein
LVQQHEDEKYSYDKPAIARVFLHGYSSSSI